MPVSEGGSYRMVITRSGKRIRLHWTKNGGVDEAKNMTSGATHSPAEFAADRKKGKKP